MRRLRSSCEVAERCRCHFPTTALVYATASRRWGSQFSVPRTSALPRVFAARLLALERGVLGFRAGGGRLPAGPGRGAGGGIGRFAFHRLVQDTDQANRA